MNSYLAGSDTEAYWYQYHKTLNSVLSNYLQMFAVVLAYDYSGLFRFNPLELLLICYLGLSLVLVISGVAIDIMLKEVQDTRISLICSLVYPLSPVIFEYQRYRVWYREQVYRSTQPYFESDHDSF